MNQNIAVLLGAGAIAAAVTGGSCSTNARIDDMNARIDDMNARIDDMNTRIDDMNTRIDDVSARIDDVVEQMREHRREIRVDLQRFDDRLRAVETEFSKIDQRLLTLERVILPAAGG